MKLFTQAWYQRMAQIFGMNIASEEYVQQAIEDAGGGSGGEHPKILEHWTPTMVAAPAAFSQVSDGYGDAIISNGGDTVSFEESGLVTTPATALLPNVTYGVALSLTGFQTGVSYFAFTNGTHIEPPMAFFTAVVMYDEDEDSVFTMIANPFSEDMPEDFTLLPLTDGTVVVLTINRASNNQHTMKLFTDADKTTPVYERTFVDDGQVADRFAIYRGDGVPSVAHVVDGVALGFNYTPLPGGQSIASYPPNCAGKAYELKLNTPIPSPIGLLINGDSVLFETDGETFDFLTTPEGRFLDTATADTRYKRFVKDNWDAYSEPNEYDDETKGYSEGSKWEDKSTYPATVYICLNASEGYAEWQPITSSVADLGTMATRNAGTSWNEFRNNSENDSRYLIGQAGTGSDQYRNNSWNDVRYLIGQAGTGPNQFRTNSENDAEFAKYWDLSALTHSINSKVGAKEIAELQSSAAITYSMDRTQLIASDNNLIGAVTAAVHATNSNIVFKANNQAGSIKIECNKIDTADNSMTDWRTLLVDSSITNVDNIIAIDATDGSFIPGALGLIAVLYAIGSVRYVGLYSYTLTDFDDITTYSTTSVGHFNLTTTLSVDSVRFCDLAISGTTTTGGNSVTISLVWSWTSERVYIINITNLSSSPVASYAGSVVLLDSVNVNYSPGYSKIEAAYSGQYNNHLWVCAHRGDYGNGKACVSVVQLRQSEVSVPAKYRIENDTGLFFANQFSLNLVRLTHNLYAIVGFRTTESTGSAAVNYARLISVTGGITQAGINRFVTLSVSSEVSKPTISTADRITDAFFPKKGTAVNSTLHTFESRITSNNHELGRRVGFYVRKGVQSEVLHLVAPQYSPPNNAIDILLDSDEFGGAKTVFGALRYLKDLIETLP